MNKIKVSDKYVKQLSQDLADKVYENVRSLKVIMYDGKGQEVLQFDCAISGLRRKDGLEITLPDIDIVNQKGINER